MQITMLKAKLHQACVTHSEIAYEGSCAIDRLLLEQVGIREYEQIDIYNINNGERLTTYAILAEAGSGIVSVNGAAARLAIPGDRVIICSYAGLNQHELVNFKPTMLYLNEANEIIRTSHTIPVQAA